jgi:mevalonate kinase
MMHREYPAKVLLYGEHTVLRGGRGLAVPYTAKSLRWIKDRPDERLLKFCDYLRVVMSSDLFDAGALEDHLLNDWRLTGDIPTGYGLGSSGAVCAAIWDNFSTLDGKTLSGEKLRTTLARMEQHFHGTSSGTDPLICYLNAPVLLGGGAPPETTKLPGGWNEGFFLVDTGQERNAADYILRFTTRYDNDPGFARDINAEWTMNANAAIEALLAGDRKALWEHTAQLSDFQLRKFSDFIPTHLHDKWASKYYSLKLCGAGGGGMMLGLGADKRQVEDVFGKVWWL